MKRTKRIALLLTLLLAASAAFGCAQQGGVAPTATPAVATPAPESTEITVIDMFGRTVTLDAPAQKVVVVNAADCEILYAIGAGEAVVGRGEYCTYPEAVLSVPAVQSGSETNLEQIIALAPQLVVMGTMAQSEAQVGALEAAGIAVYISQAQNIEAVYANIAQLGLLMGKTAEAAAVTEHMKTTFASVSERAAAKTADEKSIYFEVSPLEYGLWTAGAGTFMDELSAMLGLKNAFSDVSGWGEVSEEQVIERDPDYIVTIAMYFGEGVLPVDEILGRTGWENMKAVQNKAVLNADSNEISLPGPRLADAAEALYAFVYGE